MRSARCLVLLESDSLWISRPSSNTFPSSMSSETGKTVEQSGLARSRGAHDCDELARADLEVQVAERFDALGPRSVDLLYVLRHQLTRSSEPPTLSAAEGSVFTSHRLNGRIA